MFIGALVSNVFLGRLLGRFWADFNPTLGQLWTDYGPTLGRLLADFRSTFGRRWADVLRQKVRNPLRVREMEPHRLPNALGLKCGRHLLSSQVGFPSVCVCSLEVKENEETVRRAFFYSDVVSRQDTRVSDILVFFLCKEDVRGRRHICSGPTASQGEHLKDAGCAA